MAVIYSYPTKSTPVSADKVLISDSADNNATKQVTIGNLVATYGVSTFSAGTTGLTPAAATTGAITLAGTLGFANGGTGVTTSPDYNMLVGRGASGWELSSSSTGAVIIPAGDAAAQPAAPGNGGLRVNTQTDELEFYSNGSWHVLTP